MIYKFFLDYTILSVYSKPFYIGLIIRQIINQNSYKAQQIDRKNSMKTSIIKPTKSKNSNRKEKEEVILLKPVKKKLFEQKILKTQTSIKTKSFVKQTLSKSRLQALQNNPDEFMKQIQRNFEWKINQLNKKYLDQDTTNKKCQSLGSLSSQELKSQLQSQQHQVQRETAKLSYEEHKNIVERYSENQVIESQKHLLHKKKQLYLTSQQIQSIHKTGKDQQHLISSKLQNISTVYEQNQNFFRDSFTSIRDNVQRIHTKITHLIEDQKQKHLTESQIQSQVYSFIIMLKKIRKIYLKQPQNKSSAKQRYFESQKQSSFVYFPSQKELQKVLKLNQVGAQLIQNVDTIQRQLQNQYENIHQNIKRINNFFESIKTGNFLNDNQSEKKYFPIKKECLTKDISSQIRSSNKFLRDKNQDLAEEIKNLQKFRLKLAQKQLKFDQKQLKLSLWDKKINSGTRQINQLKLTIQENQNENDGKNERNEVTKNENKPNYIVEKQDKETNNQPIQKFHKQIQLNSHNKQLSKSLGCQFSLKKQVPQSLSLSKNQQSEFRSQIQQQEFIMNNEPIEDLQKSQIISSKDPQNLIKSQIIKKEQNALTVQIAECKSEHILSSPRINCENDEDIPINQGLQQVQSQFASLKQSKQATKRSIKKFNSNAKNYKHLNLNHPQASQTNLNHLKYSTFSDHRQQKPQQDHWHSTQRPKSYRKTNFNAFQSPSMDQITKKVTLNQKITIETTKCVQSLLKKSKSIDLLHSYRSLDEIPNSFPQLKGLMYANNSSGTFIKPLFLNSNESLQSNKSQLSFNELSSSRRNMKQNCYDTLRKQKLKFEKIKNCRINTGELQV